MARSSVAAHIRTATQFALVSAMVGAFTVVPATAQGAPSLLDAPRQPAGPAAPAAQPAAQPTAPAANSKAGSGSANARYASGGWTYTAVASNPVNGDVYAVSLAQGGKPAGHLLRFAPNSERVTDLGLLPVDGIASRDVTSAAFTSHGTLALFNGAEFFTIDLSGDGGVAHLDTVAALPAVEQVIEVDGEQGSVDTLSAWTSAIGDTEDELHAVSRDREGRLFAWRLDTATGDAVVSPLQVKPGLDVTQVGELNYAYAKDAATLVFADDQARSIEVRDGVVVGTYVAPSVTENFRELAYLPKGAPYKPVTQPAEPPAPTPARPPAAVKEHAAPPALPTTTAPQTEPIPGAPAPEALVELDTGAPEDEAREVKVTVATERGAAVEGAAVEVPELGIAETTDKNGEVVLPIPAGVGDTDVVVAGAAGDGVTRLNAGTKALRVYAAEDAEDANTADAATFKDSTIRVLVETDDGQPVQQAEVYSRDGLAIQVNGLTNDDGYVDVVVPGDVGTARTIELGVRSAPAGYTTATKEVDRYEDGITITLPAAESTKSRPGEILEAIDEAKDVLGVLAGPAAAAGFAASRGGAAATTTRPNINAARTTGTTTSATGTATTGTAATGTATATPTRSTGRTTSATSTRSAVQATGSRTTSASSTTAKSSTTSSSTSAKRGDLANTGTPMRTVIALGILAMLIGAAYVALGRRRD